MERLPSAYGDPAMIRQVFFNLLTNAVKFSRSRENAVIEIGFETGDRGNTYYVRDNGVGFDMHHVDKLFGVFQRLHDADQFEGTGIGLAIVQAHHTQATGAGLGQGGDWQRGNVLFYPPSQGIELEGFQVTPPIEPLIVGLSTA